MVFKQINKKFIYFVNKGRQLGSVSGYFPLTKLKGYSQKIFYVSDSGAIVFLLEKLLVFHFHFSGKPFFLWTFLYFEYLQWVLCFHHRGLESQWLQTKNKFSQLCASFITQSHILIMQQCFISFFICILKNLVAHIYKHIGVCCGSWHGSISTVYCISFEYFAYIYTFYISCNKQITCSQSPLHIFTNYICSSNHVLLLRNYFNPVQCCYLQSRPI